MNKFIYGKLPDFIIIGAQKCGTTSLYNYLIEHPQILPAINKEVHYFDNHYFRGEKWYKRKFPYLNNNQKSYSGEATPYYLFHPAVPKRMHSIIPNVKLIILLRNPIDRALSHYQMEYSRKIEKLSFKDAINIENKRLEGEKRLLLSNENYRSKRYQCFSYLNRGIYINQLKEWCNYFSKDQILVLKSEDFFDNSFEEMKKINKFLNVSEYEFNSFKKFNDRSYPDMEAELRKSLAVFYEPYNAELEEFLGRTFDWS